MVLPRKMLIDSGVAPPTNPISMIGTLALASFADSRVMLDFTEVCVGSHSDKSSAIMIFLEILASSQQIRQSQIRISTKTPGSELLSHAAEQPDSAALASYKRIAQVFDWSHRLRA